MPLLHCTRKLLKEMGVSPTAAGRVPQDDSKWGPWYANLFFVDHRKCILFVHGRSLASFIVGGLTRVEIKNISTVFRNGFGRYLLQEDFPTPIIETLLNEYKNMIPATGHDRSVQGSMNDLTANYKYQIPIMGSLKSEDLADVIRDLNRMPMGALKYAFPVEEFRTILGLERQVKESGIINEL